MIHSLCLCTGYPYSTLLTDLQIHKYVLARYLVIEYLHKKGWDDEEIAKVFNRDRCTVYHGKESLQNEREDLSKTLPWRRRSIERFDRNVENWERNKDVQDNYPFILESHLDHVYGKEYEPIDLKNYGQ